ncbi:MAG TPA: D-alanyl-D-alanine carboxypeptidase [Blastocatellia bacterium]|nr:D-alanyl-D-alanine carboxypeptidase [Blastocatellia bacterium]
MQISTSYLKKLFLVVSVLIVCAVPILWPMGLSVEGHGVFSRDLTDDLWAQLKTISPTGRPKAELTSVAKFKQRLAAEGRDLKMHGVYVETLDTREPIAAFNETALFNPASVMKIVTSIAALDKLGADHRFRTEFYASGEVDAKTGELAGDLVVVGGGDPAFSLTDARNAGEALRKLGIRRVRGRLIISGLFICNENSPGDVSAGVLRRNLGIPFGSTIFFQTYSADNVPGEKLFAVESDTLLHLLQEQNAHSINTMADTVGEVIGGADAVRKFLIKQVGLPEEEVFISRASGLETNRLTAWGTAKMLRGALAWLRTNGYKAEDLMPIAGIDSSTVGGRFTEPEFAGSVVAKTGTLHETDNGAATLAGIAYTKAKGAVLFVIYDMAEGRNVTHLRSVQDEFLKNLMNELGGPNSRHQRAAVAAKEISAGRIVFAH